MPPWSAPKAKVQLRLSVQRLRTLQQKKEAQAKAARRDIATLLERNKIETARIKVETLINEDVHVELLELLELYCELLLARFGLLDQNTREPDPGISEGVCSVIHAAPRTELKELHILRDILMHKYGREFSIAVMENRDNCVSERVMRKLTIATPSTELVDAYMGEIAKAYSVPWAPPPTTQDGHEGGSKETSASASTSDPESKSSIPDLSNEVKSAPVPPDLPPTEGSKGAGSSSDTLAEKRLGSINDTPSTSPPPPAPEEDSFEALARRFAALKKK